MAHPLGSSVHRLADAVVLVAVDGRALLTSAVDGVSCVLAWTDLDAARATVPDPYRLVEVRVAELGAEAPPTAGLVVDPGSATPLVLPPGYGAAVLASAGPFPKDAEVVLAPGPVPAELVAALLEQVPAVDGARSLRACRLQVADAAPATLVVHEAKPRAASEVVAAVGRAVAAVRPEGTVHVRGHAEIPIVRWAWVRAHAQLVWRR